MALWQSIPQIETAKKRRPLDVLGMTAFAITMALFLLVVSAAGNSTGVRSPLSIGLAAGFMLSLVAFILVEVYWAKSPVVSPHLLRQKAGTNLAAQLLVYVAQFTVVNRL